MLDLGTLKGVGLTIRFLPRRDAIQLWMSLGGRLPVCREVPLGQLAAELEITPERLKESAVLWGCIEEKERRRRRRGGRPADHM